MSLVTGYTSLQTVIADWLARSDLTSFIPNFIQTWEADFYRDPDNFGPWMEVIDDPVIASGVISVPSDYLGLKSATVTGVVQPPLDRISHQSLLGQYPRGWQTGVPEKISREGSTFIFGPEPDSTYTIHRVYWGKPTNLRTAASDAAAHYLIVNASDLCTFGPLMQAAPFIKDNPDVPLWQSMHDRALRSYRKLQKVEESSGSPIQEVLA